MYVYMYATQITTVAPRTANCGGRSENVAQIANKSQIEISKGKRSTDDSRVLNTPANCYGNFT